MKRKGIKCKKRTNYAGVSHCRASIGTYGLQEGLGLVKAIKLFVLHHQKMSSIYNYSFQADEGAQQSRKKVDSCFFPKSKISQVQKTGLLSTLTSLLVTVVSDNNLFCRASDGVVMLEQANRSSGIYQ